MINIFYFLEKYTGFSGLPYLNAKLQVSTKILKGHQIHVVQGTFVLPILQLLPTTLDSGINIGVRLLIFDFFPGATSLLKRVNHKKKSEILLFDEVGYVFSRGYVYCFSQMFQGLRLFKGLRLFRSLE